VVALHRGKLKTGQTEQSDGKHQHRDKYLGEREASLIGHPEQARISAPKKHRVRGTPEDRSRRGQILPDPRTASQP
jgi:hypothetical protein